MLIFEKIYSSVIPGKSIDSRHVVRSQCTSLATNESLFICILLTQPCWWCRPPDIQCSATMPSQWLRHVHSVRNAPSPTTFRYEVNIVLFWLSFDTDYWLGNCDCTAQYNCCLPATTDCRRFCLFCLILYGAPQCLWHDSVTLISTLIITYLITYLLTYLP